MLPCKWKARVRTFLDSMLSFLWGEVKAHSVTFGIWNGIRHPPHEKLIISEGPEAGLGIQNCSPLNCTSLWENKSFVGPDHHSLSFIQVAYMLIVYVKQMMKAVVWKWSFHVTYHIWHQCFNLIKPVIWLQSNSSSSLPPTLPQKEEKRMTIMHSFVFFWLFRCFSSILLSPPKKLV